MRLSPGTRLGHFDMTALLGEGGMGQVWQATDTQLNRQVALKILPDAFAADPDRLARFKREAQTLASLNHPNIAAIYGIEEAPATSAHSTDGDAAWSQGSGQAIKALVLELVEGPTLADRISKGPIPLDEALPIVRQIAGALEPAHEAALLIKDVNARPASFTGVLTTLARLASVPVALQTPGTGAKRTTFVGRDAEQTELQRLLGQVQGGRGALVLISGEPGVGKTRLAEELLGHARQCGLHTLVGHCYEQEGTQPFIPFVEAIEQMMQQFPTDRLGTMLGDAGPEIARLVPELRQLFPDLPPPIELPPEQQRRYLFNNVREFLARVATERPIVWLLDDLHWADESSLQLLQHLVSHLDTLPVLLLGTYRDVELEVGRPFERVLTAVIRQRQGQRIALKRLPQDADGALLTALSGQPAPDSLVAVIYQETEGNPFFVEEVFAHLSEEDRLFDAERRWRADLKTDDLEVPEGVRLVIGRRLERLDDDTRTTLTAAAVVGRVFDLALLETLSGHRGDAVLNAIEEAERAQLVTPASQGREARYRFTHELIRQTLVETLSLPRRQRLHLTVADAIEAGYGERVAEHAADLAHHLYQAGVADRTLSKHGGIVSKDHCRLLAAAGVAASWLGHIQQAEERLADADQAACQFSDPQLEAELLNYRLRHYIAHVRSSDLVETGRQAVELARPTQSYPLLADALNWYTMGHTFVGRLDIAARTAHELESVATRASDYLGLRNAWFLRGWLALANAELPEAVVTDFDDGGAAAAVQNDSFWDTMFHPRRSSARHMRVA